MEVYLRAFKLAGICNLCIAALRSNKAFCDRNVVRHPTCLEIVENFAQFVIDDLAKKQARKETKKQVRKRANCLEPTKQTAERSAVK